MDKQTENYIILKPLAERFNRVASEITDDDIKSLILSSIRDQIKTVNFADQINDIVQNYIDENEDKILDLYKQSILKQFKLNSM